MVRGPKVRFHAGNFEFFEYRLKFFKFFAMAVFCKPCDYCAHGSEAVLSGFLRALIAAP